MGFDIGTIREYLSTSGSCGRRSAARPYENCKGCPMAGRGIWKGNIQFGTIDIAVKLHTAVKEERVQFHLLHRRDQVRLRQQMVCTYEKEPVPAGEQTKGFEVEEGKYKIPARDKVTRYDRIDL